MKTRLIHLVVFVLGLLGVAAAAQARQDGFSEGGEVGLKVTSIGIGNRARPGDWVGIQVEVMHRSSNPKPMAIIVRWDVPNDDGDDCENQRTVTTNPNRPVLVWLYGRLPFDFDSTSQIVVRAFFPFDPEAGSDELAGYDASKHIGMVTQNAIGAISENSGLIGIVGRRDAGVGRLSERMSNAATDVPLTGHELTEVADALLPSAIPDRVHGLRAMEALIWTGTNTDEQPAKLNNYQAEAIREWIAAGGHLVIAVPLVGQTWLDTPNPLSEVMPAVHLVRHEGVSLDAIRFLLTPNPRTPLPDKSILHTFAPDASAGPFDAIPIFKDTNDQIIAVRRIYGIGAVTLIGLDVANLATAGSLRADAFWNRVLGKRLWLPSRKEVDDLLMSNQIYTFSRQDRWFENSIPGYLNWASKAAIGLLVAVVVFGGFWLIAGPVGFFVLKQRNKTQHAWVAYALAIMGFTAISWGAASMLRQRSPEAKHVTVLDHVYGQPCQRARVWANVFLPSYGKARVSVPKKSFDIGGHVLEPHPAIAAWEYSQSSAGVAEFPETRSYPVNSASPDSVEFPARSTTRQIQIDWLGSPRWSMPLPQAADGSQADLGKELTLLNPTAQGLQGRWTVTGTLKHDLPAALHNVVIIVNRGQLDVGPSASWQKTGGRMTADAGVFTLGDKLWNPGESLDLGNVTQHGTENAQSIRAASYLDKMCPKGTTNYLTNVPTTGTDKKDLTDAADEIVNNFIRLSLYSMLEPPSPDQQGDNRCAARRSSSQTLDLGRWFTQPCVIIIGFVSDKGSKYPNCPVPVEVDGHEVPFEAGLTVVRWVYPLPGAAPEYVDYQAPSASGSGSSGSEGDK